MAIPATVDKNDTSLTDAALCPMCHRALGQTAWCAVCAGHAAASRQDAIRDAREHIGAAMRELGRLTVTIDAYACDDDFGQDNQATRAIDELTQALEALSGIGARAEAVTA